METTEFTGVYDSLLEDPIDNGAQENVEFKETEVEPLLPSQPSDDEENKPVNKETESEETKEPSSEEDEPMIYSYLKTLGIKDPTKLQFESEDGDEIEERDFNSLSKEEQLNIMKELTDSRYTDYERGVINMLRRSNTSLENIIAAYQQKAIEDYLAQNPEAVHQKSYQIDDYSDDELYMADLFAKYPDFTEEEVQNKLESAKINEELFKKEVDALRTFYKNEEDRQMEAAKQAEQQQYEALQNSLLDAVNRFSEVVLDTDDPQSDSLEIEEGDKQIMLNYLLAPDKDGRSQFDKDLSDPNALIELAWLRTNGRNTITGISQYWKKELADTRKELAKTKKELEKYTKKNDNVIVNKPKMNSNPNPNIFDLWN